MANFQLKYIYLVIGARVSFALLSLSRTDKPWVYAQQQSSWFKATVILLESLKNVLWFYRIKPLNSTLCTLGNYALHILLSNVITGNMYLIKVTNPNFYYRQLYQFRTGVYTQRYFEYWQINYTGK